MDQYSSWTPGKHWCQGGHKCPYLTCFMAAVQFFCQFNISSGKWSYLILFVRVIGILSFYKIVKQLPKYHICNITTDELETIQECSAAPEPATANTSHTQSFKTVDCVSVEIHMHQYGSWTLRINFMEFNALIKSL